MKKFSMKLTDNADFIEWLKGASIIISIWSGLLFFITYLLSSIEFLDPITEPILTVGFYVLMAGMFVYIVYVVCAAIVFLWLSLEDLIETVMRMKGFTLRGRSGAVARDKIRGGVAWMVGFFVSASLIFGLFTLMNMAVIEIISNSEEDTSIYSYRPWGAALVFSFMIGARCGMAIYEKSIDGGVSDKGEVQFKAWLIGIFIFGVLSFLLDLVASQKLDQPWLVEINLGIIGILFAVLKAWHDVKVSEFSGEVKAEKTDESLSSRVFDNLITVVIAAVCLSLFVGYVAVANYVGGLFGLRPI